MRGGAMSQRFECWESDDDEVTPFEAHNHMQAAEKFAESMWDRHHVDDAYEVYVRDSFGAIKHFTVDVETEVSFNAFENKPLATDPGDTNQGRKTT